jgi:magnesium transporter
VTILRRTGPVLAALTEARRRWERHERRASDGIASLVYTLFESLVDRYFVVQDRVRERLDEIQGEIFTGAEGAAADLFRLRKELLRVPRLLAPTTHVLTEVLRREGTVPEGLRPYFADVQDHTVHVLAEFDTYRDLLAAALDVHIFSAFNRLGLIMRRLTAITVIHGAAERGAVGLPRGGGVPAGDGGVGVHPFPDAGLAVARLRALARV